jgi:hypothetical protein
VEQNNSNMFNLDVEHVNDVRHVKSQDALEDEDVGPVHGEGLGLSSVTDEVVDGNLNFFALLQTLQSFAQQHKVDGVYQKLQISDFGQQANNVNLKV